MSQTLPQKSSGLSSFQSPVADDLSRVEKILLNELRPEIPWMNQLLKSSTLARGKRMRPTLLLLCGKQLGDLDDRHHQLAAAVEMIHVATLVHDDVIDEAESRRHQPTVNRQYGTRVSILLGDYLFTHAFSVASRAGNAEAVSILAAASNRVCEGEMRQNMAQGNLELAQDDYLSIISDKTAELVAAACHIGAVFSGGNEHQCAGFEKYGRDIGVAFQIVDDVLDVIGEQAAVGKTLGTDVANLKFTLPIIHCRDNLNQSDRQQFLEQLSTPESLDHNKLTEWLQKTDSISYSKKFAKGKVADAAKFAKSIEPSDCSKALLNIAEFVLQRTF